MEAYWQSQRSILICLVAATTALTACNKVSPPPSPESTAETAAAATDDPHLCDPTAGSDATLSAGEQAIAEGRAVAGGVTGTVYGGGVQIVEVTKIATIQADPQAWSGKRVRVEGEVLDVCQMAGCWFEMREEGGARIRFKVRDGIMVFPQTAKGSHAVAEGIVRTIQLDLDQTRRYLAHDAEEAGREFDPASVTAPMLVVRLDGAGAVLSGSR